MRTDCTIQYYYLLMAFFWKSPCPFRAFVHSPIFHAKDLWESFIANLPNWFLNITFTYYNCFTYLYMCVSIASKKVLYVIAHTDSLSHFNWLKEIPLDRRRVENQNTLYVCAFKNLWWIHHTDLNVRIPISTDLHVVVNRSTLLSNDRE